jgi:hypothetical protein
MREEKNRNWEVNRNERKTETLQEEMVSPISPLVEKTRCVLLREMPSFVKSIRDSKKESKKR